MNFHAPLGALVGFDIASKKAEKYKWDLKFKARYFGETFNKEFYDYGLRYRMETTPMNLAGNYVGRYLYPLINTYRDFDQWSVYTEYQDSQLFSVSAIFDGERNLFRKLFFHVDFESNLIQSKKQENILYTFYKTGLKFELPAEIHFEMYVTNKLMNLDVHYQTFYQSLRPIFGFSIKRMARI
jgi:hypothetical protein